MPKKRNPSKGAQTYFLLSASIFSCVANGSQVLAPILTSATQGFLKRPLTFSSSKKLASINVALIKFQ